MRILHTADVHLGNNRFARLGEPWSRLEDLTAILDRFVNATLEHDVHLAIVSGDLFDTRNPRPREWAVAARFIDDVITRAGVPLVIVDGNHDGAHVIGDEDSRTLQPLAALVPVYRGMLAVPMSPSINNIGGATVVSVPYPHRRALGVEDGAKALDAGIRHLHDVATRSRALRVPRGPLIFVGHLTAAGATLGSERSMRLEDDVSASLDVLDLFDYAALGHIHLQQQVSHKGWYAGAPAYIDFGEAHHRKAFLLAEVEVGANPVVVPVPSGDRKMFDIDLTASPAPVVTASPTFGRGPEVAGGIVRVRVASAEDAREAEGIFREAAFLQVDVVAPEAVTLTERALPADTDPLDALRAYLTTTMPGTDVAPYMAAAEEYMA